MKKKYIWALSIFLVCFTLCGCHCSRSRLALKKVLVEVPDGIPIFSAKESQEELKEAIRKTVAENPHFLFDMRQKKGNILRISFYQKNKDKETMIVQVLLDNDANNDQPQYSAFASVDIKDGLKVETLHVALSRALQDLKHIIQNEILDKRSLLELIGQANAGQNIDSSMLINSIVQLSLQPEDDEGLASLAKLMLLTDDLSVGNACLVALAKIGNETSMQAIIDFAERKAAPIRRQAIIAARNIASPLAAEWLFVMAYGHEDPTVRKDAESALREVEAKLAKEKPAE